MNIDFLNIFPFFVVLGWGTNVAFTKVLTMHQLYHIWIHPSTTTLYPSLPDSWNSCKRYHYCNFMHMYTYFCTVFTLLPPFPVTFPLPLVPTLLLGRTLFYSLVLRFCGRENRKDKKKNVSFLFVWDKGSYTESLLVIFPEIYVILPIGLSPLIIYVVL
jgi:hypothetical protein